MTDPFDEVAGKLALIAVKQVPVLGLLVESVEAFLPPHPDEKVKAAVLDEIGDTVIRLQTKVDALEQKLEAQGKKLDNLGAMRTVTLTREVALAVTAAKSPDKQEAVLNAAALQFDPTIGAAARAYWFDEVRKLTDMEIVAIRMLAQHEALAFRNAKVDSFPAKQQRQPIQLSTDERLVLEATLKSLIGQDFVTHSTSDNSPSGTKAFRLTARGLTLAKYVAGD